MSIEAMKLALASMSGRNSNFHTEAITALRQAIEQAEQAQPVALPEKIYEFVPTPGPIKWHHPECEGQCIACLIEQVVQEAYGSQGLGYLQRHLAAPPPRQPLTKTKVGNYLRRHINGDVGMYCNGFKDGVRYAEAAHGIGKGET